VTKRAERIPEQVQIVDLTRDGRGVARTEGKILFVAGALPSETVTAVRMKRRRAHDEGQVVDVLVPSADRVRPICGFFGVCGGCTLQHLSSDGQVAMKQRILTDHFREAGVEPPVSFPPISGDNKEYRRRARLGVRFVAGKGRVLVGFRERFSSFIADVDSCPVLAPPADRLILPLADLIAGLSLRSRLPQVEVTVAENRAALVFRVLDPPTEGDLQAFREFRRRHGVDVYLQPGGLETVAPLDGEAETLHYALPEFDLHLEVRPTDFVQVNARINRRLVSRAVELLAPDADDRVLDLFCGLGNFTLPLARAAGKVVGVEGDAELVGRALHNAAANGIENAHFHVADLFADCTGEPWAREAYDAVLLDPPRAGALQVLPVVSASGASRIVYVSCNPASLARDAGILVRDYGYRLEGAGVVDMFPHTTHLESIALFARG
jgi:23S rRNA (uracil1939-C5)-methyltransferase